MIARAFAVAHAGTPGPVAIELPEDLLADAAEGLFPRTHGQVRPEAGSEAIRAAAAALAAAERPVLLIGGECRTREFRADLQRFCESWNVPALVANKMQDQFSNDHPLWAGQLGFFTSPAHVKMLERADLIVAIGTRLGDLSSLGFAFPRQAPQRQHLVHVYPDPEAVGARFQTDVAVISGSHAFIQKMLELPPERRERADWLSTIRATRAGTHGWPASGVPAADVFGHSVAAIASHFQSDGIITTDSGNFAGWVHRIFSLRPEARLLGSACGAMGSGVPAGLAASLRYPDRQVIAFCGDGGFLMTGNELATAVDRKADLKIVISDNQSYGTIRSHQERTFPNRPYGTDLSNPDFAALARAYGAAGFCIVEAGQAPGIVAEAMSVKGPVVIEVRSDVRQTLDKSISAPR
jgi:acetolactate synthase-1/2/3 large subunit